MRDAYPGGTDDHGPITDLWWFQTVKPVTTGTHGSLWTDEEVQAFEFKVHGIPEGESEVAATFEVPTRDHPLEVEIGLAPVEPDRLLVLMACSDRRSESDRDDEQEGEDGEGLSSSPGDNRRR